MLQAATLSFKNLLLETFDLQRTLRNKRRYETFPVYQPDIIKVELGSSTLHTKVIIFFDDPCFRISLSDMFVNIFGVLFVHIAGINFEACSKKF